MVKECSNQFLLGTYEKTIYYDNFLLKCSVHLPHIVIVPNLVLLLLVDLRFLEQQFSMVFARNVILNKSWYCTYTVYKSVSYTHLDVYKRQILYRATFYAIFQ